MEQHQIHSRIRGTSRQRLEARPTVRPRSAAPAKARPQRPVPEPAEGERQTRVDEQHAAEAADAGDDLPGEPAELAGVREAQPAAHLLTEAAGLVGLPLAHVAAVAVRASACERAKRFQFAPSVIVNATGPPARFGKPHRHAGSTSAPAARPRPHRRPVSGRRWRHLGDVLQRLRARRRRRRRRRLGRRRGRHRCPVTRYTQIVRPRIRDDGAADRHDDDRRQAPEADRVVPVEVARAAGRACAGSQQDRTACAAASTCSATRCTGP